MARQSDAVISAILNLVDTGEIAPGEEINEDLLAKQLNVSQTPIREAIIKLEAQGLLQRKPRKGAALFKPDLHEFLSILEVHAQLEGQAAGLAARRLSKEKGELLEKAVQSCEHHAGRLGDNDPDAYYQLNLGFHGLVAEASGNDCLVQLIKTNARKLMAYYRARYRFAGVISDSAHEHRQIATAILDRNVEDAQNLMAAHVQFDQVTAMDLLVLLE